MISECAHHPRCARSRKGSGRRRVAGQAMVEFALVAPLFFLVLFGTIDFALIMASAGAYDFAAHDAARVGSLIGRTDPTVDSQIVADIRSHVVGLVTAKPLEIDVYRSTSDGACLTAPTGPASTTTVDDPTCVKNRYDINAAAIGVSGGGWPADDRNDSLVDADYISVRVLYQQTFLTGYIAATGTTLDLS